MFKDYNMNQLVLPLDLEVRLQENDIAFAVHHLVESIPDDVFDPFMRTTGCPAYHPRMMWLAQGNAPSYRTINRFRVHPAVTPILKQAFVTFRCHLV
ncbi:IS5/IS1182 family transposase, partial [Exiguobacterium sp. BRG2]|nr:IS5/IS1182 family transposase [Exiguobacterium sp. BRG2]